MADRQQPSPGPVTRPQRPTPPTGPLPQQQPTLLRRVHDHVPNSAQVIGFLTLLISGGILLVLTGLTVTLSTMGLIVFAPLIILSSPIWVPPAAALFVAVAGLLMVSGFGLAGLAGATWVYRYYKGRRPVGSERVDYARGRIADTAGHVKDYAREYGGYLQSKPRDAAPGA
ncbi:Oleosin 20.3 kDa [Acorus gramineus]|uniref:Oleosin 20.3 kDa n=1 Tax=Acorus gramineus TaxID=55184 RepID=A0AAV9AW61_ACOGR|nr:Oleosin 20.3 kDa [Acorus gramineus]